MMSTTKTGVVILLENTRNRIAMQLRDNHPDVPGANCWGLFGGWTEESESFEETATREIQEELGIQLDPAKLSYIRIYREENVPGYVSVVTHIFQYPISDELQGAILMEGQRYQFWDITELKKQRVVPHHLEIVEQYEQDRGKT